jgi:hypothetical protein
MSFSALGNARIVFENPTVGFRYCSASSGDNIRNSRFAESLSMVSCNRLKSLANAASGTPASSRSTMICANEAGSIIFSHPSARPVRSSRAAASAPDPFRSPTLMGTSFCSSSRRRPSRMLSRAPIYSCMAHRVSTLGQGESTVLLPKSEFPKWAAPEHRNHSAVSICLLTTSRDGASSARSRAQYG